MEVRSGDVFLIPARDYARGMREEVLPYLAARRRDRFLSGAGNTPLFVSAFSADEPRGTVLALHGFTETVDKFSEIIYSLLRSGFSVLAYDQRGHGRSGRAKGLGDATLVHVDRFDEYVEDLSIVCRQALAGMPRPWSVFCHSMGGAVTALFLEKESGVFTRAAMCAPMIAASAGPIPLAVAKLVCGGASRLGLAKQRTFISKPYAGPEDFAASCAGCRERFDWYEALRADTPEFQTNGPSYGWTSQALRVTARILKPGAPEKIAAPVRLYTAALDLTVLPGPQKAFIDRVPQGSHVTVEGAKHEIFRSTDDVLFPWWQDVLTFLKAE